MFEAVIRALITLALFALLVFLVIWVLESIGIALPLMVVRIIWVIAVLIAILIIYRIIKPFAGSWMP